MRLIGVIDLAGGRAVHARGGVRTGYAPVGVAADCPIDGDAVALARAYVGRLGLAELYAADLDAIATRQQSQGPGAAADLPAHEMLIARVATVAPLWLDAGISSPAHAHQALALGAARVVVGLETLQSFNELSAICTALGKTPVAFSLDLREGVPIAPRLEIPSRQPADLAARAADAGAGAVIVLDVARAGEAIGPDMRLVTRVRASMPGTKLMVGGGIRGLDDLVRLAEAGCDGALLATALHDGRLDIEDICALSHVSESL